MPYREFHTLNWAAASLTSGRLIKNAELGMPYSELGMKTSLTHTHHGSRTFWHGIRPGASMKK